MSKRRGDFVTLDELIERIGVDATRWFMLSRSHDSTIDLDLELAAKQDPENPVYYVQMMHARIAGDLPQLPSGRVDAALAAEPARVALNDAERELIRKVLAFPREVREAVARRAPHRIASYALELGQAFAAFYRDSPVRDEPDATCSVPDRAVRRDATHAGGALALLGVSAPEPCDDHRLRTPARAVHPRRQPRADPVQRPQCVFIAASQLRACAETFEIIAAEGRATRTQASTSSAATRRRRRRALRRHAGRSAVGDLSERLHASARRSRAMRLLLALPRCSSGGARERRGAAADAVLAADRLAAVRAPVDDGGAQARRQVRRRRRPATCSGSRSRCWWTPRTRTPSRCRWTR